jgi:hypothetical protein
MNKAKLVIGMILASMSMSTFAADPIPDPTVQIMAAPIGLPTGLSGAKGEHSTVQVISQNELNIQGVFISNKTSMNKVFMSGGFYKVGDVVGDLWKVKSITRSKVVLVNTETKQTKNLNISGE